MPPVPADVGARQGARPLLAVHPLLPLPRPDARRTGFIRGPNTIPGVRAPGGGKVQHEFAETWREQKLRYEQNDRSNATVPV